MPFGQRTLTRCSCASSSVANTWATSWRFIVLCSYVPTVTEIRSEPGNDLVASTRGVIAKHRSVCGVGCKSLGLLWLLDRSRPLRPLGSLVRVFARRLSKQPDLMQIFLDRSLSVSEALLVLSCLRG